MKIKISEIVKRVFDLLDENAELLDEKMEYCDPESSLRPLIIDLLPDAARVVLGSVSTSRIDECAHLRNIPCEASGNIAIVSLPSDFLRLVWIRMEGWTGGVTEPLAFGGEEHRMRLDRAMLRARRRISPAVAIRNRGDSSQLEILAPGTGLTVAEFDYLRKPEISATTIELPPGLVSDVCRKLAEMVGDVIG